MKHYTESKWNELDAIDLWGRNRSRAENIRAAKASYRRRERRVLNRMVEEQVVEELSQSAEELRFLWGEQKEWGEFAKENSYSFSAETWR